MQMVMTAFMICVDLYFDANLKSYIEEKKEKARSLMVAFSWLNALLWMVVPFLGWSSYGFEPTCKKEN